MEKEKLIMSLLTMLIEPTKNNILDNCITYTNESAKYVIVRTYSAGVFAGYLSRKQGKEVTLDNARRIWKWVGAASLSQLAMEGTSKPEECKFPQEVNKVTLTEVIEILDVTETGKKSIQSVKEWKE